MYVEFRKTVQMNPFSGQEQRRRCKEETCEHSGKEAGGISWEIRVDMPTVPCVEQLLLLSRFRLSDSVRPHRRQPTRLPRPWDSPGKKNS